MGPGENRLFWRNGHIQSYRTGQKTALQRKLRLRSATQSRANSVTRPDAVSLATTQRLSSFSFRSNRRRYHPAWNSARGVPDAKAESAVRSSARRSQRSLRCAAVQVGPLRQWIGDTAVRRTELATSSAGRPLVATANQLALRLQAPPTRPRNLTLPACVLDRAQPLVGPDADQAYADFRRRRWPHMQCLSLVCRARGERGYLASAGSNYEGGPASVVRAIARQSDCEHEQRQAYAWHEGRENGRRIMHGSRRAWGRADTPGDTCKAAAP